MEDIVLSFLIIFVVALSALLIFFLSARKNRNNSRRMQAYCARHGYRCHEVKQRLHSAAVLQGKGWQLTTGARSSDPDAMSGSLYTVSYTRWETLPLSAEEDTVIWLGTVPYQTRLFQSDPAPLFAAFGISDARALRVLPLNAVPQDHFVMIAADRPGLARANTMFSRMLADWPIDWPLLMTFGKSGAQFAVAGKRFDQPQDLDRLIRLGTDMLACYQAGSLREDFE